VALAIGCSDSSPAASDAEDNYALAGPFADTEPLGKMDNAGVAGPLVATNTSDTQIWTAKNAWEDIDTPDAKKAGMAWGENSGLNWDQKYKAWVDSMERAPGVDGYSETFKLTTPWGKVLPSPKLECSEVAMFLRIAFASWYGLPFYMTSTDSQGTRVYFGHFGARTATARYQNTPRYATAYRDYSDQTSEQYTASWPRDEKMRTRGLTGGADEAEFLGATAKSGAYFDEIFLNKRVGWFMLLMLDYFGSMNLANSRNTFNVKAQGVAVGDVLVERWQKNGIGHTLVVKKVTTLEGGKIEAQLASGSMPRRQPKWEDGITSKNYFTSDQCGGEGKNWDGDDYVSLGGGLKRWRVTKNIQGAWTNTWMKADESMWINDTDYETLKKRPAEFGTLLGEVPPEQMRDALLGMITSARNHLKNYPASCSARENREKAFTQLYSLLSDKFSMTQEAVDAQYRILDDYVFAPLVYSQSKTCCWNSTTPAMYQIIMDYNTSLQANGCTAPVVFKVTNGGYKTFSDYAAQKGKSIEWKEWTEDEPCAQKSVDNDLPVDMTWTPFCK
jgi:hypothetical protein